MYYAILNLSLEVYEGDKEKERFCSKNIQIKDFSKKLKRSKIFVVEDDSLEKLSKKVEEIYESINDRSRNTSAKEN